MKILGLINLDLKDDWPNDKPLILDDLVCDSVGDQKFVFEHEDIDLDALASRLTSLRFSLRFTHWSIEWNLVDANRTINHGLIYEDSGTIIKTRPTPTNRRDRRDCSLK